MTVTEARAIAALVPDGRLHVIDRFSSPAGLELRTFLARNGLAFEWVDLDADPLARFSSAWLKQLAIRTRTGSRASAFRCCYCQMDAGWRRLRASRRPAAQGYRRGQPNRSTTWPLLAAARPD